MDLIEKADALLKAGRFQEDVAGYQKSLVGTVGTGDVVDKLN